MDAHQRLLLENKAWVKEHVEKDPEYYQRMAGGQHPVFLWIGSSDSRVPPELLTNAEPGEFFVHRNVANLVTHTDFNLLSVLQHAVENLGVRHIVVCGHYGCSGVRAAMGHANHGLLNKWIRNVKDVYRLHEKELEAIHDEESRLRRLVELNVVEQVRNLAKTSIVQKAWTEGTFPLLHGWVYELKTGLIHSQIDTGKEILGDLHDTYRFNFEQG